MWRSTARARILSRSIRPYFSTNPTLAIFSSSPSRSKSPIRFIPTFLNKFFSSVNECSAEEDEASHRTQGFVKNFDFVSQEAGVSSIELGVSNASPIASVLGGFENEVGEGHELNTLWEESIGGDATLDSEEIAEEVPAEVPDINNDQLESVLSILQSTLPQDIGSSLDRLEELSLSEEFVVRVFQDAHVSGENLVSFFRWAIRKEGHAKYSRALGYLVSTISASDDISKMEAYMLWDLIKELGELEWNVNTDMLNQLISIFWKLGKAKAALDVFNKFDEFGCAPDGYTFYFTIEALGKKSMIDTAWSVCEKMLNSGSLPDVEKICKIITFFCKGKKAKEAHLVFLLAKENNILPGRDTLSFLVAGLCRNDESVRIAMELLEDYPQELLKHENKTFSLVVKSLVRIKDAEAAKSLLLRMVDSGPPPGSAAFNYVITGLCKEGEVVDAIALTRVMECRGLRPDVYTYSVIMSGFAKAGLMDEAFKIFCEAKKKHKILTPVLYHILIRGYCRIEEYEKALECLKDMKEHGVQPNADEYSKLIRTLCLKAIDWRTAEKLSEEMKERGLCLRGETSSLIAAVKMLEEEIAPDESKIEA
ncbi:pentatricopeptide repeat-containing protein At3g02650, mitochondrial [Phalaenopsis equestris]|uniref:pentatricopeptide repeat-containing protein At3g02650, mitochondrial n=1 Tax=Phalaenopsis equestris TaxID=78828 RepID=UPI0009E1A72B|nr:pentatricopeptide repeat-containing protein At3g02650, mitochondrial [Phalaenopsis equestris]